VETSRVHTPAARPYWLSFARAIASSRSCVMNSTPIPCLFCNSMMSLRICACVVTSSAVVGSSAISSAGSRASAMAIITRWRWPPESWCG